jgi:hypothetical protein
VGLGHSETVDCVTLKVEFNQHSRPVADDPTVMTGLYRNNLGSRKFRCAAILVLNVHLTQGKKSHVCVHAELSTNDIFQVPGPAKSWRIDYTFDTPAPGANGFDLNTADLTAFSVFQRREQ